MSQSRLELLPVELQLSILENVSSRDDLTSLTIASRPYNATYFRYKKLIVSQVTRSELGNMFVDACMLYHWKHNINSYTEVEDDGESSLSSHQPTESEAEAEPAVDMQPWPTGPYRHIQLKFLHDCDKLTMAGPEYQAKSMRKLFTVEDFSRILSFHNQVVQPLAVLCAFSFRIRRDDVKNPKRWDPSFEARTMAFRKRQCRWIERTLYRYSILLQLYGTPTSTADDEGMIDLSESHREAIMTDFLSRYGRVGSKEFQIVQTVLLNDLDKDFDLIRNRLELLMRMEPATTSNVEVAAELVRRGPLHLSQFKWDALMGAQKFHDFTIEWPESWSGEICGFWE